jgi:predicted Co/Zn/Cd cation transporter (cation efflux family)
MQQQPAMVLAFCTFVFIIFNIGYVELVQSEIDDMIPNATAII